MSTSEEASPFGDELVGYAGLGGVSWRIAKSAGISPAGRASSPSRSQL
jgi:hypothetical protein